MFCVTIRIYINLPRQSNLQLEGPSFWSCEALGRLPTLPKAKAGTGLERKIIKGPRKIHLSCETCSSLIQIADSKVRSHMADII